MSIDNPGGPVPFDESDNRTLPAPWPVPGPRTWPLQPVPPISPSDNPRWPVPREPEIPHILPFPL